jgi:hypothetical protein
MNSRPLPRSAGLLSALPDGGFGHFWRAGIPGGANCPAESENEALI